MDTTCGICLEEVTRRGVLDSCSHAFCFKRISKWKRSVIDSNRGRSNIVVTCPVCKAEFSKVTYKSTGTKAKAKAKTKAKSNPPLQKTIKKRTIGKNPSPSLTKRKTPVKRRTTTTARRETTNSNANSTTSAIFEDVPEDYVLEHLGLLPDADITQADMIKMVTEAPTSVWAELWELSGNGYATAGTGFRRSRCLPSLCAGSWRKQT